MLQNQIKISCMSILPIAFVKKTKVKNKQTRSS